MSLQSPISSSSPAPPPPCPYTAPHDGEGCSPWHLDVHPGEEARLFKKVQEDQADLIIVSAIPFLFQSTVLISVKRHGSHWGGKELRTLVSDVSRTLVH
jgi:hypothetical protein